MQQNLAFFPQVWILYKEHFENFLFQLPTWWFAQSLVLHFILLQTKKLICINHNWRTAENLFGPWQTQNLRVRSRLCTAEPYEWGWRSHLHSFCYETGVFATLPLNSQRCSGRNSRPESDIGHFELKK